MVGMRRYGIWIDPGSVDLRAWAILETLNDNRNENKIIDAVKFTNPIAHQYIFCEVMA